MKFENGEYSLEISIDSYEFPYHETNDFYDNNWLNVRIVCEDDVLEESIVEPCLLSSELADLGQGLSKVLLYQDYIADFLEPILEMQFIWKQEHLHVLIVAHLANRDFKVEKQMNIKDIDALVSEVKQSVIIYGIREKKLLN